jgi:hypothetical protein
LVLVALVVGLVAGGLFSYYGISKDGTDTYIMAPPAKRFDSPRVTDMAMPDAIETLVSDGYRVVAVGHGRVVLQEMGSSGHVLRVVGEEGGRLRYCTARLPNCVAIQAPPAG